MKKILAAAQGDDRESVKRIRLLGVIRRRDCCRTSQVEGGTPFEECSASAEVDFREIAAEREASDDGGTKKAGTSTLGSC